MLPTPSDKHEEKAISDILEHGHHVINVLEEDDQPGFSYSVGMWHSYQHAEVIVFGLKQKLSHWILNEIGRRIGNNGEQFESEQYYSGFLEGFECVFFEVPRSQYKEHVGWDIWLYGSSDFPLIQCVWPNTEGCFPWEEDASDWFRKWQPVLKSVEDR